MKRNLLGSMPNVLVVHLQRIYFSFDTLMNDKNNSRFEFPSLLNLEDYSYKNYVKNDSPEDQEESLKWLTEIADDDYIYRLVGVNIHVGTADHGHYYSLINTKRGEEEPDPNSLEWSKVERDNWMKFDDSSVSHFNFSNEIEKEAFGGQSSDSSNPGQ